MKRLIPELVCALVLFAADFPVSAPKPGITLPCQVTEIVDGDTITVEVQIPMRVRLKNCYAPELRHPGGAESKDHLRRFAGGKRGVLHVPLEDVDRVDKAFTFGRVIGDVWIDGRSVVQEQVDAGHAAAVNKRIH
jgi:endonuclease YncB( thermonuclease family)